MRLGWFIFCEYHHVHVASSNPCLTMSMWTLLTHVHRMVKLSSVPSLEVTNLFRDMKDFILECNGEQIRAISGSFADLCHIYTTKLVQERKPILGVDTLVRAISKVQVRKFPPNTPSTLPILPKFHGSVNYNFSIHRSIRHN